MSRTKKDHLYAEKLDKVEDFVFDKNVASVFNDMIQRSVPGYTELNQLIPIVANQFIKDHTQVYDLGCSLGEASISIAKAIQRDGIIINAIDNSEAMIEQLSQRLSKLNLQCEIKAIHADICKADLKDASFVVLNYTLQFVEKLKRDDLITTILF